MEKNSLSGRLGEVWRAVQPGEIAWRGAAVGTVVVVAVVTAVFVYDRSYPGSSVLLLAGIGTLMVIAAILVGGLSSLVISLLARIPVAYRWALFGGLPLLFLYGLFTGSIAASLVIPIMVVVPASLVGSGLWVLSRGSANTKIQRSIAIAGLTLGLAIMIGGLVWLGADGEDTELIPNVDPSAATSVEALELPDPSERGAYRVLQLTYGSGLDRHRPEYGAEADLQTQPVDGTPFVDGWDGITGWIRDRYWGFSVDALPLNGRVWYPDGDGPFPLVLIVHGNHQAEDFSDAGYAYLGELMASRGFIFVSVDQNFLNLSTTDLFGGLRAENDARGWLLLEHLRVWREWSSSSGGPFAGKIDLENLGLIGHSRGGEAVSEAAAFNRLRYYPDDATVSFDYGFDLRAVIGIAPVDDAYNPTGVPTPVENVNYLVLQGSHDGDVPSFAGMNTWERVSFTDDNFWFKSAIYIGRANHGQFNTGWGRSERGPLFGHLLNLKPLIPAEEQERIARVLIGAFLEATLHDETGYIGLFRDLRAGRAWLPRGVYLQRYQDSTFRTIANFEEDIDVTTTTVDGGAVAARELTLWREELVTGKFNWPISSSAVFLGWEESTGSYEITLPPPGYLSMGPETVLVFSLADANEDPGGDEDEAVGSDEDSAADENSEDRCPIDLTIELTDAEGRSAALPLGRFSRVQPQIEYQLQKAGFMNTGPNSEIVLQSFELPLVDFADANADFDPSRLERIRFIFDRSPSGVVVVDDLGLTERRN